MNPDEEPVCKLCGDEYVCRDGCEPTDYCDLCAHLECERLAKRVAELEQVAAELVSGDPVVRAVRGN